MNEKLNVKTIGLILAGVIIVVGVGYGGYRLLKKEKPQDNNNTSNNQNQQISTVTDLGDGWMKYENNEYGFSFEYPQNWGNISKEENILSILDQNLDSNCQNETHPVCENISASIITKENIGENITSIENWFNNIENTNTLGEWWTISERTKTVFGKQPAWILKEHSSYNDFNMLFVYILNPNNESVLEFSVFPVEVYDKSIFQKIIKSIKFE